MPRKREVFGRWPLVLPHAQIRRMLDSHHLLISTRDLHADAYEVHDASTVRLNYRRKRDGRSDLQDDPAVFVIEVTHVERRPLLDLDLVTVRRAGFKTLEDFYLDWIAAHRRVVVGSDVRLYTFAIAAEERYLHRRAHRGYTRNPGEAVRDEPQPIDSATTLRYAADARDRYAAEHADDIARREARALGSQLRAARAAAAARGVDVTPEIQSIRAQLDKIQSKLNDAA